jgi:hypothetical protein
MLLNDAYPLSLGWLLCGGNGERGCGRSALIGVVGIILERSVKYGCI